MNTAAPPAPSTSRGASAAGTDAGDTRRSAIETADATAPSPMTRRDPWRSAIRPNDGRLTTAEIATDPITTPAVTSVPPC
jgi:hypothetical protein